MSAHCPSCGRPTPETAAWCIHCRYDFATGMTREAPGSGAQTMQASMDPGDAAGEHLNMHRGNYSAWVYVVLGFCLNALVWGVLIIVPLEMIRRQPMGEAAFLFALVVGAGISVVTYWDRWRCNEAFTSRYLSGIVNISLLYAPILSCLYANYRGVKKFLKQ
ncbi:MAG: hypothetical protein AB1938_03855 [Myxococcota bacterium]